MTHTPFTGAFTAITTPFNENDGIDHEQIRRDIRRLESAGVDGIVPCGSTGESATLTHDEHIELIKTVVDEATTTVIAGTGSNATCEAISLSNRAAEVGADGLLLVSPYYNLPHAEGLEEHYRTIADAVDLPQLLYNVPGRTGSNIPVETAVSLASHGNIVGYKAASTNLERISEVIERTQDETFSVLSGDDPVTLPILSVGGTGVISVTANVVPEQVTEMVHMALDEEYSRAREIHHRLGPLSRAMFMETNPIPIKEAMAQCGYGPNRMRLPLTQMSDKHKATLREVLADFELV